MKPRFLFIHSLMENIGIEYISAILKKKGYEVDLLFFLQPFSNTIIHLFGRDYDHNEKQITAKVVSYQPDVICFSPFSFQYPWAIKQARFIKTKFPEVFILFGGVHVNSAPDSVIKNQYVDGLVVGEAEFQILEFAKNFKREKLYSVPSVWIKKKGKIIKNPLSLLPKDLDVIPFPDKDLFYKYWPVTLRNTTYVIMGSRGCPYHCTYCSNNVYSKMYKGQNRLRFRSPENVVSELIQAKKKYKFRIVEFFDDVLTTNEAHLRDLFKLYKRKVDLPFTCHLHPQIMTENIIRLLKLSECCWVKLGVQSGSEEYRRKYLERYETNADIIRMAKLCHKYKLLFSLDHIFNLPGETNEDLVEAVRLYNTCRPAAINFGGLNYLPNTEIVNLALKLKILSKADVNKINQGGDLVSGMSSIEMFFHQDKKNKEVNVSVFSLLFVLTTVIPSFAVNYLLEKKVYLTKRRIPVWVLLFFKLLSNIRSRHLYLCWYMLKYLAYYTFIELKRVEIEKVRGLVLAR
jgi:anaerobic magnesium-protoporphyrin IX monomethyl ester cyclase